jgi:hypothetical protein
MKKLLALTLLLSPLALHAQTDAMPPEHAAPPPGYKMQMPTAKAPAAPSKSLLVTYNNTAITLSVQDLLSLPQTTITAHNGHTNKDETYTGPLVSDVLAKAGLASTDENHKTLLHSSVIATGTDGYFVLYSAAELSSRFASAKAIIAVMRSGLPNTDGGNIQLVNPADTKPARWVHGLSSLTVMSIAPIH